MILNYQLQNEHSADASSTPNTPFMPDLQLQGRLWHRRALGEARQLPTTPVAVPLSGPSRRGARAQLGGLGAGVSGALGSQGYDNWVLGGENYKELILGDK